MSCVHDACRQGREVCHREACQAEESCDFPLRARDLWLLIAVGVVLWFAIECALGVA